MLFLAFWISKSDSSIKCSDAVLCSMLKIGCSIQSFLSSSISTIPAEFTSKNRPSLLNQQSPLSQAAHSKSNISYIFQYDPLHSTQKSRWGGGGSLSDVFRFSSPSVTPSAAARVRLLARTDWLWHLSALSWTAEQHCYSSRDIDSPFAPAPWSCGLQRCIFGNLRVLSV